MKIINMPKFVLGCINITLAIVSLVLICNGRSRLWFAFIICALTGIDALVGSIETEKQRQQKIAELKEKARLYGWDKEVGNDRNYKAR